MVATMLIPIYVLGGSHKKELKMKTRKLGKTEIKVSELVLGGGYVGGIFLQSDEKEKLRAIQHAINSGINLIDTAPSYSPDSKFVTFNSDRSGYQQIYVMNSDGSNVKRISFGKGLYGTPVWSPRGDLIAFTKLHKGKFYIGVMRTDGKWNDIACTKSFPFICSYSLS